MILADTSVWVDHFRAGDKAFREELLNSNIATHPFVIGELALGTLPRRAETLRYLRRLPILKTAQTEEVLHMIETRALYGRGIGLIDAHLIASTLIHPSATLWTRDKRLRSLAEELVIAAALS